MNSGHHHAHPALLRGNGSPSSRRGSAREADPHFFNDFWPFPRGTAGVTGIRHLSSRSKPNTRDGDRPCRQESSRSVAASTASTPITRHGPVPKIKDLLYKNRLIVLKDQAVTEQQYCDFANRFGSPGSLSAGQLSPPRLPADLRLLQRQEGGKQIGVPRTGGYWHSDTSFETDPKFITMLMPKVLPMNHAAQHQVHRHGGRLCRPAPGHQGQAGRRRVPAQRPHRYKIRPDNVGYDIFEILQAIDRAPPVRHPASSSIPTPTRRCSTATAASPSASPTARSTSLPPSARDLRLRRIRPVRARGSLVDGRHHHLGQPLPLAHLRPQHGPEEETMMHRITLQDGMPLCASQMTDQSRCLRIGLTVHLFPGRQRGEQERRIVNAIDSPTQTLTEIQTRKCKPQT